MRQRRSQMRDRRQKESVPTVALVGYTNAGKTTLFNRLAREQAVASDALFVTLDPLTRQVRLPGGGEFLLSDTVGFIDRLPHALVAAFRATLEEVAEADLLLHVIDASEPRARPPDGGRRPRPGGGRRGGRGDPRRLQQGGRLDARTRARICRGTPTTAVLVSARTRHGRRRRCSERVAAGVGARYERVTLSFDPSDESDRDAHAPALPGGSRGQPETTGRRAIIEAEVPPDEAATVSQAPSCADTAAFAARAR